MPGIRRALDVGFDDAIAALPDALKAQGFGVLTHIDVKSTLNQKLGVEFRRYQIFGACHPPSAFKALGDTPDAGIMIPCNVIVYEADDGRAVVVAVDPNETFAMQGSPTLQEVATDVRGRLERVVAALP